MICVLRLNAPPMRGKAVELAEAEWLLKPLKDVLPGVSLKGKRFYLREPRQEWMEASLAADGLRKVGTLKHLISKWLAGRPGSAVLGRTGNQSQSQVDYRSCPGAHETCRRGHSGVHRHPRLSARRMNCLLPPNIGRRMEWRPRRSSFVSCGQGPREPVQVQFGETLTEIEANPILEEFSAL